MKEVEKGNHLQDLEELHHLHYQNNRFVTMLLLIWLYHKLSHLNDKFNW